ncbi:hypothetical protein Fmac_020201 [Flemingia macrophylla]|uniref:EF-hand domain-containing protein n=1 Tax=Flemingia macrophylla TaxID=520843 RepID=A0ABD1LTE9_9FABA
MRSISSVACFTFIFLVLVTLHAEGRAFRIISSSELVSDGIGDGQTQDSYLYLKGSESSGGKCCEQMYGFLPCSNNILGHLFLILVYEYLLFHGESYLAAGGAQIFNILGPGIFGASVFDILGALPESLILLVTGLSSDGESAQEYVSTGVGLLAGSSILHLTVVWGTCVVFGNQQLPNPFTGFGITMDVETRKMAMIMVFSAVPLIIMQFSYTPRAVTLMIAFIVAVIFLISYFIYQIFKPHIETARLEYIKHGHLILRIFQHVQKETLKCLLTEDGTPNELAINGLYDEINPSGDKDLSISKIRELLIHNNATKSNTTDKQIEQMLQILDRNGDQIITKHEFVQFFRNYIDQTKHALENNFLQKQSLEPLYQDIIKPWMNYTKDELESKRRVLFEISRHVWVGKLCKDDGTPDESAIRRVFEKIDLNQDNNVSRSELEQVFKDIQYPNMEEALKKMLQELDRNRDNEISTEEFMDGVKRLLNTNSSQAHPSKYPPHENHKTWEDVEKLVKGNQSKGVRAWLIAIGYVVLGITMLSLLAEPLIASVQKLSEEAGIPSFFISFVLVPVATNFREATSAIREASHKKIRNTSQTIYEIYGAVFMNNILGFVVVSVLIYVRHITWQFSADVLVVAIVCAIMGLTSWFRSTFPLWTVFPAYLLYFVSLLLVFVLKDVLNYV